MDLTYNVTCLAIKNKRRLFFFSDFDLHFPAPIQPDMHCSLNPTRSIKREVKCLLFVPFCLRQPSGSSFVVCREDLKIEKKLGKEVTSERSSIVNENESQHSSFHYAA